MVSRYERAKISKPIVYEHFGGKEGLYAVVVDREMEHVVSVISQAISWESPRSVVPFGVFQNPGLIPPYRVSPRQVEAFPESMLDNP